MQTTLMTYSLFTPNKQSTITVYFYHLTISVDVNTSKQVKRG